jgi:DNA-binding MarR family transcriptional regulator
MDKFLPLPTLLSQAFVAFTIECDNEFERQMPHRTTDYGLAHPELAAKLGYSPWLVSMAMWFNCMKYVDERGIALAELEHAARTPTNFDGMRRWGYITLTPNSTGTHSQPPNTKLKSKSKPKKDWLIHAKPAGLKAREVWQPLCASIEQRWHQRFGNSEVTHLRQSLSAFVSQLDPSLPDTLPILGYGLSIQSKSPKRKETTRPYSTSPADLELPTLMARALLAFALEYERQSQVSLAVGANLLRLFEGEAIRIRDLPRLSGISKEAAAMAIGFLEKNKYAATTTDPGSRSKAVTLTAKGRQARQDYQQLMQKIEAGWHDQFGKQAIGDLHSALSQLNAPGQSAGQTTSRFFEAIQPHPGGWRSQIPAPEVLPHFPMVLHRGGYPDGS